MTIVGTQGLFPRKGKHRRCIVQLQVEKGELEDPGGASGGDDNEVGVGVLKFW